MSTSVSGIGSSSAASRLEKLKEEEKNTKTVSSSKTSTKKTQETQSATKSGSSTELKKELEVLKKEKELNLQKMEKLEDEIEKLAQEAEDNIIEAAKKQEEAVKEHEKDAKEALDKELKKYIEANKEGGDGMSKSQLQTNIKNSMPDAPKVAQALAMLVEANHQIAQIDGLLDDLNMTIADVQLIDADIESTTQAYDAAVKSEKAKSCDPIGFTVKSAQGEIRYDFIVDDGSFDSTKDFLGAQNQWAEMTALDKSGDGVVNAEELSKNNIKAVKTKPDGTREVVDIAKEFGPEFSIDLSTYKQGGSHDAINTTFDADNDGVKDQQLLGTFDVNIEGQEVKGYNTLDDVDFLQSAYGVEDNSAASGNLSEISEELAPHVNFFEEFSAKAEELSEKLYQGYESLGLSKETIEQTDKQIRIEGTQQANIFSEQLEKEKAEKLEEFKEEEAKKAEEIEKQKALKAQEAEEDEEIEEIDDEEIEDDEIEDEESFEIKDISSMSPAVAKKYIESIEEAISDDNEEAKEALRAISESDLDNVAQIAKTPRSNNTITDPRSVDKVISEAKELLSELKSQYL